MRIKRWVVEMYAVSPDLLCPIHCYISVAYERRRLLRVLRKKRYPDTGGDINLLPLDEYGLCQHGLHAIRGELNFCDTLDIFHHHDEFIATLPCYCVGFPHALFQAVRHHLQQDVACSMAQGVIDLFEAIEVDEQDRNLSTNALS